MNYRHAYHAGNFADVFKHALLTRILAYLMRKDAALRFIDTHAGIGWYDLAGEEADRTGEWRDGIGRLVEAAIPDPVAGLLQPYLKLAASPVSGDERLPRYPGSPALAAGLLRRQDRLILCELHPADFRTLAQAFSRDRRVKAIEIDGYTALRAYVPPVERRGLVLVDPPFEERGEFARLAGAVADAWRKWPGGVYCLWYPLKDTVEVQGFFDGLADAGVRRILRLELMVKAVTGEGPLAATGLAVVNPPFVLEEEARQILPYLSDVLAQGRGAGWRVDWAAGE